MAKYKYANLEHTSINDIEAGVFGIHPGVYLWAEVNDYIKAGGVIEDFETQEESLTKARVNVENNLVNEKMKVRSEGILVDGVLFDTDSEARLSYLELMIKLMMDPEYSVADWKASDGVWVTMDNTLFQKIVLAWEQKLTSVFSFVKSKENEIKSKSTKEELDSIDLDFV